jgi:hypothetical protein
VHGNGLVEGIVLRAKIFFRVKSKIYDWTITVFVHYSFLVDVRFLKKLYSNAFLVVLILLFRGMNHSSDTFQRFL